MLMFRNRYKKMVEPLAVYLTLELLHVIEQLHRVGIIHGDIKVRQSSVRKTCQYVALHWFELVLTS